MARLAIENNPTVVRLENMRITTTTNCEELFETKLYGAL